jgi:hypothetical protein
VATTKFSTGKLINLGDGIGDADCPGNNDAAVMLSRNIGLRLRAADLDQPRRGGTADVIYPRDNGLQRLRR